jgi:hypothetical protein
MRKVKIAATQGVYALFANYDYSEWQAIGEFIDNSVSSWERLRQITPDVDPLVVQIKLELGDDASGDILTLSDNAGGISEGDLDRAFALGIPPIDRTRINKFGVGMKVAACWFAKEWEVRSTAWDESVERRIVWKTAEIVATGDLDLPITETVAAKTDHFTEITLKNLIHSPRASSTQKKIKNFLPQLYRKFIEKSGFKIFWNEELLLPGGYEVLEASYFRDENGPKIRWERNFEIILSCGKIASGRVALLSNFSRQLASLNLFWRNRLIRGNIEPSYKPQELFGLANSFRSGRLYIEVDVDDFEVTTDKKSIDFGSSGTSEPELLGELRSELSKLVFPILQQAEGFRAREFQKNELSYFERTLNGTTDIAQETGQKFLVDIQEPQTEPDTGPGKNEDNIEASFESSRVIIHNVDGEIIKIKISCVQSNQNDEWYNGKIVLSEPGRHTLDVVINLRHPFVKKHLTRDTADVFFSIIVSLVYGELKCRVNIPETSIRKSIGRAAGNFLKYMINSGTDLGNENYED